MAKDKVVVVTGSSGMLGMDLSQELNKDCRVVGIDIKEPPVPLNPKIEFLKIDISDEEQLRRQIDKTKPDFVIHAAAYTDVDGCELNPEKAYLLNAEVSKSIAQICSKKKTKLIFISTDFVFDGKEKRIYNEADVPNPLSVYGKSKLRGERYIAEICSDFYIFRTAWLFGKWGKNFVRTIIEKAKAGENLRVVDDQRGCPTYTKDISFALAGFVGLSFEKGDLKNGIFHLVNEGNCSWCEFAKAIVEEVNLKVKVEPITSEEINRPAKRPAFSILDCSKFKNLTNIQLRRWRNALREYIVDS